MTRLSILGLTDYDPTVWEDLELPEDLDRQDTIDYICAECAELSLTYPQPAYMRKAIGIWSRKNLPNWLRIQTALNEEYNPLHNFDRYEDWTDKGTGSSETRVAGFNEDAGMAPRDRADSTGDSRHQGHLYGNIGVTTSAQMIQGEMDVRTRFNLMDTILSSFKEQFCIQIY